MTQDEALEKMKAPGAFRPGIWRGGVIQIMITNVCNLNCNHCTAGVGHARAHKLQWFMTPAQFREAVESLKGCGRVIGCFGGNPCVHPKFEEICSIFREVIPDQDQRGLWSNDLRGHGAVARETFSPRHSNLNVHRVGKAFEEMARDWPEALQERPEFMENGMNTPSMHGSFLNGMRDVIPDAGERWKRISTCYVNQTWSAQIRVVKGELMVFFCEIAATRAEMADVLGEKDTGIPIFPGWWAKEMPFFKEQVCHHCHRCGIPLNGRKIEDSAQEPEMFTSTNAPLYAGVRMAGHQVTTLQEIEPDTQAATQYLQGAMRPQDRKP